MDDEPISQEIELNYGIKERKEDILTNTWSTPFQLIKQFRNIEKKEWNNKLIFADNLQTLKYIQKLQEKKEVDKIKLIYIDPPFGTGDIYDASGAPAYSATLRGAEFIEFLRKRLILLKELLADDGSIYVRIDYHFGHYIKVIMDEIFGKNNFKNEIIVNRRKKSAQETVKFNVSTEIIFFYTKTEKFDFHKGIRHRKCSFCGAEKEPDWHIMISSGIRHPPERMILGKKMLPPKGFHWTYSQKNIDRMTEEKRIRINQKSVYTDLNGKKIRGMVEYLQTEDVPIDSSWTDVYGYTSKWKYPTENSEDLLARVIETSSNEGDIILDCFAGSGTTGCVAEKLDRKWIMVDSSKLAIYTIVKRLHSLKKEIGNKGKPLKPEPFGVYNAGLYLDGDNLKNLSDEEYKKFALELFQVESADLELGGLKMDGKFKNSYVHIFPRDGSLTEDYITDLDREVGGLIKERMFIIVPANRVFFLQDYVEMNGRRYYALRIPYSVIDELHNQRFKRPLQPKSVNELNQTIDSIGFDFIHPPEVDAEYSHINSTGKLIEELEIKIKKFNSVQRTKNPIAFEDKESLSMVLIDRFYNESFFNLTDYFFADTIKKEGWKIQFPYDAKMKKIMIIYLDVLGNERIEVKGITQFKRRKS